MNHSHKKLLLLCLGLLFLRSSALTATPYLDSEQPVFVSGSSEKPDQHGVRQYRIPHLTKGPKGELVVSVAGRTHKSGDNGHTTSVFAKSNDQGKTWQYFRFESDYSKPTTEGAFPMCHRTNEVQVEWFPRLNEYVALYCDHYKCYLIRSKDLKTWGAPMLIPHQDGLARAWPSPTSMHVEKDGTLCFNMVTIAKGKEKGDRHVQTFWTKDAKNFRTSGQAPTITGECNAMKMANGKYLYVGRARKKNLNRLLFTYDAQKKIWGDARSLSVPTHYSCQQDLLIDGKNIYISVPLGPGRTNGGIYLSQDLGQTWKLHHKMKEGGVFGYSSMVMLDGEIGVLAEQKTEKGKLLDQVYTVIPAMAAPSKD